MSHQHFCERALVLSGRASRWRCLVRSSDVFRRVSGEFVTPLPTTRPGSLPWAHRHSPPLGQRGIMMPRLPRFPGRKSKPTLAPPALPPGSPPAQPSQHDSDRALLEAVVGSGPLSDDEGRNSWRPRGGGTPPGSLDSHLDCSVCSGSFADSYGLDVADGPGSQPAISLQRRNADTRDASPAPKQRRGAAASVTLMPDDSS